MSEIDIFIQNIIPVLSIVFVSVVIGGIFVVRYFDELDEDKQSGIYAAENVK